MAKQKLKQLAAKPSSKTASRSSGLGTPKLDLESDLCVEDGWVLVRKQRVIIWVPSLPVPENCTAQKPAPMQSQAELGNTVETHKTCHVVANQQRSHPETCPDVASADKPEKLNSLDPRTVPQPICEASERSRRNLRIESEKPGRVSTLKLHRVHRSPVRSSRQIRWPRAMCRSSLNEGNDNVVLKQRLSAANLERKVWKAGGLNEWLATIGLGEKFERILRGKRLSKSQVANLTMEKLKQMGASAVGPRRKLIHAIRCVYHPYCLTAPWKCYT